MPSREVRLHVFIAKMSFSYTCVKLDTILTPVPTVNIQGCSRVTEANQNVQKLLSTDFINTTELYIFRRHELTVYIFLIHVPL